MIPGLLLQIVTAPAVAALVILALGRRIDRGAGWVAFGSLVYSTLLLGIGAAEVLQGRVVREEYFAMAPGIEVGLLADGLSLPTLGVINILCAALGMYSIRYIRHRIEILYAREDEATQAGYFRKFFSLFLWFPVGFAGVCLSTNLVALYFFMEVLTIALYFLMAYFGYMDRVRVAFICLTWGIVGALFVLTGSLMTYGQIGSLEISEIHQLSGNPLARWIVGLFIVGLLTKLAIVPFHVWMPWVHAEHPTCIAGLLAVYANLALYIMVRVLVVPLGDELEVFGTPLMVMALLTMIYGSLLTMAQTDIKRLAACSTISQIAYSVLGVGALTTVSVEGGMFFFLSHIMGKTVFFSTAGIIVYVTGVRDMRQMGGLARKMPVTALLWGMGAMMLSGFPPFSSFAAEWIMFTGIFERAVVTGPGGLAIAVLGISAILLTVGYAFGAMRRIFFGPLSPELADKEIKDPPWTMSVPLLVVAGGSMVLGLYPALMMNLFDMVLGGS